MSVKMSLKAARVNANLTQEQAGEKLGVSKDVVSNWERQITYPDVIMLGRIEEVYGVSYSDLIFLPQDNALSVKD